MHVAHPHVAVAPTVDGDVLVALWPTSLPLTGRQVAARVPHRSQKAVSVALDRLVTQGIVHRQEAGRAYLHTPNYEHLAAPAVAALVGLRAALIDRLRIRLRAWSPQPHHASLFGSTARGDGDAGSDIDLLIVRPDAVDDEDAAWRRQVDELTEAVLAWTGNPAGIVELSLAELVAQRNDPPEILTDLQRDGVDLAGVPLREALGRRRSGDEPSAGSHARLQPPRRARTSS
jgi:predicted nucleotidyltransferase